MGRGIGRRCLSAALLAIALYAAGAEASESRAVERFRAAAALQQRGLFDLAAAEYAEMLAQPVAKSLADQARLQRGICLFQIAHYDEARSELQSLHDPSALDGAQAEQYRAHLGLATYNLGRGITGPQRDELLDDAIATLDQYQLRFPQGTLAEQTSFYRAEALYARGRRDAAVNAYRELLVRHPQHPQRADALYAQGVAELELGRHAAAAATLESVFEEYPNHAAAQEARLRHGDALLAIALEQVEKTPSPSAVRDIERLLLRYPNSTWVPPALLGKARAEIEMATWQQAERTLSEFLSRFGGHDNAPDAQLLRATVRLERGDFSGGWADAEAALAAGAAPAASLRVRGLCELGLHRPADGARTFEELLTGEPKGPALDQVLYDLAWAYHESNDSRRAIATFARLADTCPQSPLAAESNYRVADARYSASDVAAAAERFRATAEFAGDADLREKSLHRLAWCQFEQREYEAAFETFGRQLASCPEGPLSGDARIMAAECRFQQQQFEEALQRFTAALEHKKTTGSLRELAFVHATQAAVAIAQWQQTLQLADRALQEFPRSDRATTVRCDRGTALFQLSHLAEAEREFTAIAAADAGEHSVRAEFMLGQIYDAHGKHEEAVRAYFKAAYGRAGTDAPDSHRRWQAEAVFAAAKSLEGDGREDAACKLYQELVERFPKSERTAAARKSLEDIQRR